MRAMCWRCVHECTYVCISVHERSTYALQSFLILLRGNFTAFLGRTIYLESQLHCWDNRLLFSLNFLIIFSVLRTCHIDSFFYVIPWVNLANYNITVNACVLSFLMFFNSFSFYISTRFLNMKYPNKYNIKRFW